VVTRLFSHDDSTDIRSKITVGSSAQHLSVEVVVALEKRQVRILPSEVRRTRLQWPQKGRETGAMMPISPRPSSKVKRRAVSLAA
jgi:hypothetical protein